MGAGSNSSGGWRVTDANKYYELCPSYPAALVVPVSMSDKSLSKVAKFRSKGRSV